MGGERAGAGAHVERTGAHVVWAEEGIEAAGVTESMEASCCQAATHLGLAQHLDARLFCPLVLLHVLFQPAASMCHAQLVLGCALCIRLCP